MSNFAPIDLSLDEVLAWNADIAPDEVFIENARGEHQGAKVSYREMNELAQLFAEAFNFQGAKLGDRIAIIMEDSIDCVAAIFGAFRLGAIVVPIDKSWGKTSQASIIESATPSIILASDDTTPGAIAFAEIKQRQKPLESNRKVPSDRLAMLAFTSGTTGNPKGVMISHQNFRHAYEPARVQFNLGFGSKIGCIFKLSGLGILGIHYLLGLVSGATVVVLPEALPSTVRGFWSSLNAHRIDFVYVVPSIVQLINKFTRPLDEDQQGRQVFATAAAPISLQAHTYFQEKFSRTLFNIYGLTEASFAIFLGKLGEDGRGLHTIGGSLDFDARLVTEAGDIVSGAGTGILEIKGPTVSAGYWNNPTETKNAFNMDWFTTGDIAYRDKRGNHYITGRAKDVAIRSGFNIHLEEVDQVISQHPDVITGCSVGIENPVVGEEIYALAYVTDPGTVSETELLEWCRICLGKTRTPVRIIVTPDALPTNAAGKLLRGKVKEIVLQQQSHVTTAKAGPSLKVLNHVEGNKYNDYSSFYDLAMNRSGYYDYEGAAQHLLKHLPKEGYVLEIGVGTGLLLERLAKIAPPGIRFLGVDHTQEMIDVAEERFKDVDNVELMCADICDFKSDEKFDFAFSHGGVWVFLTDVLLSHINNENVNITALNNLFENIKDDGELAINIQPMHKSSYTQLEENLFFRERVKIFQTNSIKEYILENEGEVINSQTCLYKLWRDESIDALFDKTGFERFRGCEKYNILRKT
mmetsp:Transcript_24066/g.44402  ORF Transcript_24066/g.44402 Transcript_24066/m.44402 type:complete len:750 (+) Transcript_24066:6880-9129(+)